MTGSFTGDIVVRVRANNPKPFEVFQMFEFHAGDKGSGFLTRCEKGFSFDGTSMPWGMRWLISPSDPDLLQCAAIHDKGFSSGYMIRVVNGVEYKEKASRKVINDLMAEAMIVRGVRKWKRVVINAGLKVGSAPTWNKYRRIDAERVKARMSA